MKKCVLALLDGNEIIIAKLPQYVISADSLVELSDGRLKKIKEVITLEDGGAIYNAISNYYTLHSVVKVFTCVWEASHK